MAKPVRRFRSRPTASECRRWFRRVSPFCALRDYLHLTGTKCGCGHGDCDVRTVLVDGTHRKSCQML